MKLVLNLILILNLRLDLCPGLILIPVFVPFCAIMAALIISAIAANKIVLFIFFNI